MNRQQAKSHTSLYFLRQTLANKHKKDKEIKEKWADSGEREKTIEIIREKCKVDIPSEDIPF